MQISGHDHILYSDQAFPKVEAKFERMLAALWGSLMTEAPTDPVNPTQRFERFYSQSAAMTALHHQHGFNTQLEGQGCILLIGILCAPLDLEATIQKELLPPSQFRSPAPYGARILLSQGWQYTLVTPGDIRLNPFSKTVHELLLAILSGLSLD